MPRRVVRQPAIKNSALGRSAGRRQGGEHVNATATEFDGGSHALVRPPRFSESGGDQADWGEAWPLAQIIQRRDEVAAAGLAWRVVESVPVSEAIKTRSGDWARQIENYRVTLERLGAAGIGVVVYNFMPVMDWVRTDLRHRLPDGSEALRYDPAKFAAFDLFALGSVADAAVD